MEQQMLEKMIKEALLSMTGENKNFGTTNTETATIKDYPLSKNKPNLIKSSTGKGLNDFTVDNVMNGSITPEDIRIAPETLEMQAQVAESDGRKPFAQNLRRAAELIAVPDNSLFPRNIQRTCLSYLETPNLTTEAGKNATEKDVSQIRPV